MIPHNVLIFFHVNDPTVSWTLRRSTIIIVFLITKCCLPSASYLCSKSLPGTNQWGNRVHCGVWHERVLLSSTEGKKQWPRPQTVTLDDQARTCAPLLDSILLQLFSRNLLQFPSAHHLPTSSVCIVEIYYYVKLPSFNLWIDTCCSRLNKRKCSAKMPVTSICNPLTPING